jgi:maleate cis-trans isomerase
MNSNFSFSFPNCIHLEMIERMTSMTRITIKDVLIEQNEKKMSKEEENKRNGRRDKVVDILLSICTHKSLKLGEGFVHQGMCS